MDTLRKTSPNFDNLAKQGVTFHNCFATGNATVRSSVTLLTGKYLLANKVDVCWDNVLDRKFITLAEYLKRLGYYTMALLTSGAYRSKRGFEQGFDYFRICYFDARQLTTEALNYLNKRQKNKPLFVWLHFLEPHAPYYYRKEYFKVFEEDRLYKENKRIITIQSISRFYRQFIGRGNC
jgi:arylsulfatase A-like enzyme